MCEKCEQLKRVLEFCSEATPANAHELGFWLSKSQTLERRESLRRRGREAVARARKHGIPVVSTPRGYYLARNLKQQKAGRDFLRKHALSELNTAKLQCANPNQLSVV